MCKLFGVNDIRGVYPKEVNEDLAYRLGRELPGVLAAKKVAVGYDVRISSPMLAVSLSKGLFDAGCMALDIGLCGTEMLYYAVAQGQLDAGVMVTASHNPKEYNGFKLVGKEARPLAGTDVWQRLQELVLADGGASVLCDVCSGEEIKYSQKLNILTRYIKCLLSFADISLMRPLKVVANVGNGAAGVVLEAIAPHLPVEIVQLNSKPDGTFPHGVPNPLLPENREVTASAVRELGADLGVAWDGDFDRCFFFDEQGDFVDSCYMVGLLARTYLNKERGAHIVHDMRCTWGTLDLVRQGGGVAVPCPGGHALIKRKMRETGAVYGGEMSAHHYFRDFSYCDSGMIPWLLVLELLGQDRRPFSYIMRERREKFPVSGEINRRVQEAGVVLANLEKKYGRLGKVSHLDGLSVESDRWRFNVRSSNTEPGLLRLNVETRGDRQLCDTLTNELLAAIGQ